MKYLAARDATRNSNSATLLCVKLDRPIDRGRPCSRNICIISVGKGPHAGELHCADCGQHRGWLSKATAQWIEHVVTRFGAPTTLAGDGVVVGTFETQRQAADALEADNHS